MSDFGKKVGTLIAVILGYLALISSLPYLGVTLSVDIARICTIIIVGFTVIYLFIFPKIKKMVSRNKMPAPQQAQTSVNEAEVKSNVGVEVTAKVEANNLATYQNPFTLKDIVSALSGIFLSGFFIYILDQIQKSFPPSVVQATSSLTLTMLIILAASVIVLLVVVSGFIREFMSKRK